jgi:hypothetical protein
MLYSETAGLIVAILPPQSMTSALLSRVLEMM